MPISICNDEKIILDAREFVKEVILR